MSMVIDYYWMTEMVWTGTVKNVLKCMIFFFKQKTAYEMRISDSSSDVCSSDLGTGVLPCVPKTLTSGNAKRGLFTGQDFLYDDENDRYTCPAGQYLTKGKVRSDRRDTIDHYRNLTDRKSVV